MEKIEAKTGRGRSDEKAKQADNVKGGSGDFAYYLETNIGLQVSLLPYAEQRFFDRKAMM